MKIDIWNHRHNNIILSFIWKSELKWKPMRLNCIFSFFSIIFFLVEFLVTWYQIKWYKNFLQFFLVRSQSKSIKHELIECKQWCRRMEAKARDRRACDWCKWTQNCCLTLCMRYDSYTCCFFFLFISSRNCRTLIAPDILLCIVYSHSLSEWYTMQPIWQWWVTFMA